MAWPLVSRKCHCDSMAECLSCNLTHRRSIRPGVSMRIAFVWMHPYVWSKLCRSTSSDDTIATTTTTTIVQFKWTMICCAALNTKFTQSKSEHSNYQEPRPTKCVQWMEIFLENRKQNRTIKNDHRAYIASFYLLATSDNSFYTVCNFT